jgi:hypothetical protein
VGFKQVDSAAMDGHWRGVWQPDSMLVHDLQALVLAFWITAIRLEDQSNRRKRVPFVIREWSTKLDLKGEADSVYGFTWTHHATWDRACSHLDEASCNVDVAL